MSLFPEWGSPQNCDQSFQERGVNFADLDNSFRQSGKFGEILDGMYRRRLNKFQPNLPVNYREKSQKVLTGGRAYLQIQSTNFGSIDTVLLFALF
jgi:hypothetical protein